MDTRSPEYTERMIAIQGGRFPVLRQLPYRWHLRGLAGRSVLEIGCGIGRNLRHLADREAVGIDENETSVAVATSRGFTAFVQTAYRASPFASAGRFDTLLLSHVAEHLSGDEASRLIADYLPFIRERGRVILITPQEACHRLDETHVELVDFAKGAAILEQAGVRVERQVSFPLTRAFGRWFRGNEFVTVGRK